MKTKMNEKLEGLRQNLRKMLKKREIERKGVGGGGVRSWRVINMAF